MKIQPFKQHDDSDCGPACLYMTAQYFDLPYSFEQIGKMSKYKQKKGLSNEDLVSTAQKLGLTVRSKMNAAWGDLMRSNTSKQIIIVSWMKYGYMGHFSIVERVDEKCIYLADPESGNIEKIEKIMFMRLWMDYDDVWYPAKNTDIQLRWMCIISKGRVVIPRA